MTEGRIEVGRGIIFPWVMVETPVISGSNMLTVPRIPHCSVLLPGQKVAPFEYSLNTKMQG